MLRRNYEKGLYTCKLQPERNLSIYMSRGDPIDQLNSATFCAFLTSSFCCYFCVK